MCRCNTFKTNTKTYRVSSMLAFICLIVSSCMNPLQPVSREEEQLVKAELDNRSFRQFEPSRDANKRKSVILDFFDGVRLWAQYSEDRTALSEWEIFQTIIASKMGVRNTESILKHRARRKYSRHSATIASKLQGSPFRFGISSIARRYGSS